MKTINWSEFDEKGIKFQAFCNDILSFEFGKSYVPFSAPGKDKGVDGLFEGKYNGKEGKWRFQAKFKNPETGRQNNINSIKNDVKSDLGNNVHNENHVVFLTNIDIGPEKRKEIIELAKDINEQVEFDIWDLAKINTLLSKHPILKLWYIEDAKHLIREYSEYFHKELDEDEDSPYQFSNKFYHRDDKLSELKELITNDEKLIGVVSGEQAGIGKTRLCVEFFKKYIDSNEKWFALVLVTSSHINFEIFQKALEGDKNYVVLIDDADKLDGKVIRDILSVLKGKKKNKVKLLLTVRNHFLEKTLSNLSAADRTKYLLPIKLGKLSRKETLEFLEEELKELRIKEFKNGLAQKTQGVPILITTLITLIKKGVHPSEIKDDFFIKQYVSDFLKQFIEVTHAEKEVPKRSIDKVINLFALIEPIQIEDDNLIQLIAEKETDGDSEDVEIILHELRNHNIITGKYIQEIKPDLYSDLILEKALDNSKWLEKKLSYYSLFTNNIIKNVGYALQNNPDNSILTRLLSEYILKIDDCDDSRDIEKILKTVSSITYQVPKLSLEAVNKTISIYSDSSHPLYKEFQSALKYKGNHDSVVIQIKSIINQLFELGKEFHVPAFKYSGKLYNLLNDESMVSNISSYGKLDLFQNFKCIQQNKILEASRIELNKEDSDIKLFALKTLHSILKLEENYSESDFLNQFSIRITTLFIPENKEVAELRKQTIELLIKYYFDETDKELRNEAFDIIIDIPREIFAARRKEYTGKKDIELVLAFLNDASSKNILELNQKQSTKNVLYRFERWGVNNSLLTKLKNNLQSRNLTEIFLDLFNPNYGDDIDAEMKEIEEKLDRVVADNSGEYLGKALLEVIEQSSYPPHHFYNVLGSISSDHVKAKEFIDFLWTRDKEFVFNYCPIIFRELRFSQQKNIYWKYIQKLKQEDPINANNCILNIYDFIRVYNSTNEKGILAKDANVIIDILESSSEENNYCLATALPTLFLYDKQLAVEKIAKFIKSCNERQLNNLFIYLTKIVDIYYEEIKTLVLNQTIHTSIPYSVQTLLNKIIRKEKFSMVLNYFEQRFLFKRKSLKSSKTSLNYDFVPLRSESAITAKLSDDKKNEIFTHVLKWFVEFEYEPLEHHFSKNIISLFAPDKSVNEDIKEVYVSLIKKYNSDQDKLKNIIQSLSEFEQKNILFIELMVLILESIFKNTKGDNQKSLISESYFSLISFGGTISTPGEPRSEDLNLKDLIENTLKNPSIKSIEIKDFFRQTLKSINENIQRDTFDTNNNSW